MHDTAMLYGEAFFKTYLSHSKNLTIVDIGSQDVNGSLRSVAPSNNNYIGVDFIEANGVDVVITDPYKLPFEDESLNAIVSSPWFEHSEFCNPSNKELIRPITAQFPPTTVPRLLAPDKPNPRSHHSVCTRPQAFPSSTG